MNFSFDTSALSRRQWAIPAAAAVALVIALLITGHSQTLRQTAQQASAKAACATGIPCATIMTLLSATGHSFDADCIKPNGVTTGCAYRDKILSLVELVDHNGHLTYLAVDSPSWGDYQLGDEVPLDTVR